MAYINLRKNFEVPSIEAAEEQWKEAAKVEIGSFDSSPSFRDRAELEDGTYVLEGATEISKLMKFVCRDDKTKDELKDAIKEFIPSSANLNSLRCEGDVLKANIQYRYSKEQLKKKDGEDLGLRDFPQPNGSKRQARTKGKKIFWTDNLEIQEVNRINKNEYNATALVRFTSSHEIISGIIKDAFLSWKPTNEWEYFYVQN